MKKKWIGIILTAIMLLGLLGCGSAKEETGEAAVQTPVSASDELLNKVWDCFSEDQKFYVMGGDFENSVYNAAGIFSMEDTDNLTYMLFIPADNIGMIDEAASMIHGMNANTFTAAAFHLSDPADADVLVQALKDNITGTQWICGFPDKLAIYIVNGEYVVSAFGSEDNMSNFMTYLVQVYGEDAVLKAEESLL